MIEEKSAIEAFNWGIIDKYVDKDSADTIARLKQYINEAMLEYFIEASKNIQSLFPELSILYYENFIKIFQNIIQYNSIVQYYVTDKNGSFLLIDGDGNKFILAVYRDKDLDQFCEFYAHEKDISKYVNQVSMREQIPFFGLNSNPAHTAMSNWHNCFLLANCLDYNGENIYWGFARV